MSESCGSIEVVPSFEESDVFVIGCALVGSGPITSGTTATYEFDVQNNNPVDVVADSQVLINGNVETTQQVSVAPNTSTTVSVEITFSTAGNYDISAQVTNEQRQDSVSGL